MPGLNVDRFREICRSAHTFAVARDQKCMSLHASNTVSPVPLLDGKNAVIYGGGGAIGGAVARAFAHEGARVFLAGRTLPHLQAVADDIARQGGTAEAAQVDAGEERAVVQHLSQLAAMTGRIDVLFDAIGIEDVQGVPLLEIPLEDFVHPIITAARTKFATARAVARHMVQQGSGVIMTITGEPTPAADLGGFMTACAAVEGLWRTLACELGPRGVRLVVIRSAGSPDAPSVQEVVAIHAEKRGMSGDAYQADRGTRSMLRRLPLVVEVANAATLLASDRASAMTAMNANVTCGAFFDL
jgi:NAD(P)-dependent dehydrogenase (short-subunit alcohol dehydrogenase family)